MIQNNTPSKIVIVEDNTALNDIYKTRLEMLGYICFSAYDGVQALSVIEREIPDLVLLDLMVPKKAGDQILEEMRRSEWGKHIKVMIISNLNEADAPAGLRNLGIEGYAVKANLSNDQLDQLVDVILKPAGQVEDVVLGHDTRPEVLHQDHPEEGPLIPVADPFSGTSKKPEQPVIKNQVQNPDPIVNKIDNTDEAEMSNVWPVVQDNIPETSDAPIQDDSKKPEIKPEDAAL